MSRCLELASNGIGYVAPNPMVGAVLVHNDRVIGEGFHRQYGAPHAEVNCIASVKEGDRKLIANSTLYVSLEPCAHFGRTPPCTDLIIKEQIKEVVIGCRDPFVKVNGLGIETLQTAGVKVVMPVKEIESIELNKRFFTFHKKRRPYVILKWAQSSDKFIASGKERLHISGEHANRLVHKWRSEESGIVIGTNTAMLDNPYLTTRLWPGNSPVRIIVDNELRLPDDLNVFDNHGRTVIFNTKRHEENEERTWWQVTEDVSLLAQMMNALHQMKIQSIMVEGGAKLLQSFIDEEVWDEARVITNSQLVVGKGLPAPQLFNYQVKGENIFGDDKIEIFTKN